MSANAAAAAGVLIPRRARGWRMGLANMLGKENAAWWRTRRWWTQCLIALFFLNLFTALNLRHGGVSNAVNSFLMIAATVAPLAAIIMGQDAILGERLSGTAAWVLSKPLRRPAFILAKLIAYGLGLLATWVVLPGAVAYLEFAVLGKVLLPIPGFAAALGLAYLNLIFYLTLVLMLATLFQGRGPVVGIPLFVVWGWMIPPLGVALADVMPWRLLSSLGQNEAIRALAVYMVQGQPLPTAAPIIATALWCVLFTGVAIWRMGREEF
jgi:ABC-type transport system involved in multi-copper enzyme maturation permease subunit